LNLRLRTRRDRLHHGVARCLLALLLAGGLSYRTFAAPAAAFSEKDFKGVGRCQFAAHGFVLSPQTELAISDSVQKLLDRHQAVFGFRTLPDFRLRMRIFGKFDDYRDATFNVYWTNAAERRAFQGRLSSVAGYYTSITREIITWQQHVPGSLGTTLLHEASHAIMDAHYEDVPLWLLEGSAEYFAFALHPPGEMNQILLRHRWTLLNQWLKAEELLPLRRLLDADSVEFKRLDPEKSYAMSWSLFQLLMSSDPNRRAMLSLLRERQPPTQVTLDSSEQVGRLYPGGLKRLENDWHAWIRTGAGMTNPPTLRFIQPKD
jgi:hypothetical protein